MMYLGKDAVAIAKRKSANGILESIVTPSENSYSITFPVESKPYGVLIVTNDISPNEEGPTIIRTSVLWTEYQGGQYATGRYVYIRPNGEEDHWTINAGNTYFVYDNVNNTFTSTVPANSGGYYRTDREYYLWYFTMPFDNT